MHLTKQSDRIYHRTKPREKQGERQGQRERSARRRDDSGYGIMNGAERATVGDLLSWRGGREWVALSIRHPVVRLRVDVSLSLEQPHYGALERLERQLIDGMLRECRLTSNKAERERGGRGYTGSRKSINVLDRKFAI